MPDERTLAEFYGGEYQVVPISVDWARGRAAALLAALGEPSGQRRLLELGSSYGWLLATAAEHGWRATGVELDPRAVEVARTQVPDAAILEGTIEAIPTGPGEPRFDAIVAIHVIEHVTDPLAFLRAIAAWLAPGGRVLIATPNLGSLEARLLGSSWDWAVPPAHLHLFDRDGLARLFDRAGFEADLVRTGRGPSAGLVEQSARTAMRSALALAGRRRAGGAPHRTNRADAARGSAAEGAARRGARLAQSVADVVTAPLRARTDARGLGAELIVRARPRSGAAE